MGQSSLTKDDVEEIPNSKKKDILLDVEDTNQEDGFEKVVKKLINSSYQSKIQTETDLKKYAQNLSDVEAIKNTYLSLDWAESLIIVKEKQK